MQIAEFVASATEHETLDDLKRAHLAGKHHRWFLLVDANVLHDVHHERGFAHGRTGRDDEHFTRFEAVAHAIEHFIARGKALRFFFPSAEGGEIFHHLLLQHPNHC